MCDASPHTDAKGIMDLVKFLSPKHVILVHGEKPKMALLKERIQSELGIQTYVPANHDTVSVPSTIFVKAHASDAFIHSCLSPNFRFIKGSSEDASDFIFKNTNATFPLQVSDERVAEGILVMDKGKKARVIHQDELPPMLGQKKHEVQFAYCCPVHVEKSEEARNGDLISAHDVVGLSKNCSLLQQLFKELSYHFPQGNIKNLGEHLQVESFYASLCLKDHCPYRKIDNTCKKSVAVFLCCTWSAVDEKLACEIILTMEKLNLTTSLIC